jgi:hypothetical protein
MLPELLQKSNLYSLLYRIDMDLAGQCREYGCPYCGGRLHQADYGRKPRGGPVSIPEPYLLRHSFCCGRPDCRKRTLPPSCRFWGRRVYWGCVILVVMALRQGRTTGFSINKIMKMFAIDRKTVCRWILYFREYFPTTDRWRKLRGRVSAQVQDSSLPTGLLEYFFDHCRSYEIGLLGCLHFLAAPNEGRWRSRKRWGIPL